MHVLSAMDLGSASFESGRTYGLQRPFYNSDSRETVPRKRSHQGRDAILRAAVVMALQSIPSRINDPLDSLVVTVGMMNGGTKENILADHVELVGYGARF